jgi:hypothetical protein
MTPVVLRIVAALSWHGQHVQKNCRRCLHLSQNADWDVHPACGSRRSSEATPHQFSLWHSPWTLVPPSFSLGRLVPRFVKGDQAVAGGTEREPQAARRDFIAHLGKGLLTGQ